MTQLGAQRPAVLPRSVEAAGFMTSMTCSRSSLRPMPSRRVPLPMGLTELQLSPGCEVEDGKAERAFMVGERVVHDSVG
jgi:hypothetical protein